MTKDEVKKSIREILLGLFGDTDFKVQTEAGSETGWTFGKNHVTFTEVSGKFEVRVNRESWCSSLASYDPVVAFAELSKLIYKKPLGFIEDRLGSLNPGMMIANGSLRKLRLEYNAETGYLGISILDNTGKTNIYEL